MPYTKTIHSLLGSTLALAFLAIGCNVVDDEPEPTGGEGTGGPSDNEVCVMEQTNLQCEYPYVPLFTFDGGNANILAVDDPAAQVGVGPQSQVLSVGASADYLANYVFQNSRCTAACVLPCPEICAPFGTLSSAVDGCLMCSQQPIDVIECATAQEICQGNWPPGGVDDSGGADESGGVDDSGGADDSGGDDTGGAQDVSPVDFGDFLTFDEYIAQYGPPGSRQAPFDCSSWAPATQVRQRNGTYIVPRAVIDALSQSMGEELSTCDLTRLTFVKAAAPAQGIPAGAIRVASRTNQGLLAALGIQTGDVIVALDGKSLSSREEAQRLAFDIFLADQPKSRLHIALRRGSARLFRTIVIE